MGPKVDGNISRLPANPDNSLSPSGALDTLAPPSSMSQRSDFLANAQANIATSKAYLVDIVPHHRGADFSLRTDGPRAQPLFAELDQWSKQNPSGTAEEAAKEMVTLMHKYFPAGNSQYEQALQDPKFTRFMEQFAEAKFSNDKTQLRKLNRELGGDEKLQKQFGALKNIQGENLNRTTDLEKIKQMVCREESAVLAAGLLRLGFDAVPCSGIVRGDGISGGHAWQILPREGLLVESTVQPGDDAAFKITGIKDDRVQILDGAVEYTLKFAGRVREQNLRVLETGQGAGAAALMHHEVLAPNVAAEILETLKQHLKQGDSDN